LPIAAERPRPWSAVDLVGRVGSCSVPRPSKALDDFID
jgi:hypothetical protein